MLLSNYSARSGLIAQQQRLDIIANNIANVNTVGFKAARADFKDMVYQEMRRVVQPQDGLNLQKGHGVMLGASNRDFTQGAGMTTGNSLDVYLVGEGFFAVQNSLGETCYTRDGAFAVSKEEDGNYLVTGGGLYVLNTEGERINLLNSNVAELEIAADGTINVVQYTPATETTPAATTRTPLGKLGLHRFMNRNGLEPVSNNLFKEGVNSGPAEEDTVSKVEQGLLENANVELAVEMTRMIRAQRSFSLASRALKTADEMDGKTTSMRG